MANDEGSHRPAVLTPYRTCTRSFYSSQGRTSLDFLDANANLVDVLRERHYISTLEMETFVLNHLALSANLASASRASESGVVAEEAVGTSTSQRIRTGAVQMM